ncbi:Myrcene synthase protein [Thalictrum thalictroides]|uniref:Myrcene synthase protein n=1 Tax=Thalictrum thalictroides TaxID=46969 RepID=A0A7J6VL70_THATH|nr:Myrcene synthase protein [Thalictrum thalictroides]
MCSGNLSLRQEVTMALTLNFQANTCLSTYSTPRIGSVKALSNVRCRANIGTSESLVLRRSANYQPSIWDFDYIQSLNSKYTGKTWESRAKMLKESIRCTVFNSDGEMGFITRLEMIDHLGRLGVSYHFQEEIRKFLDSIAISINNPETDAEDLHVVALYFRVLRQYEYQISPDVFNCFKDNIGQFKWNLCKDIKGMLSLYEASHLAFQDEDILDEAKAFTLTHLKDINVPMASNLAKEVKHSLELPLHWRMLRLEARWYIEVCKNEGKLNPALLEFATLDFNMVQAIHQNDLKEMTRWWENLGLGSHPKLSFARDRIMENFLWTTGVIFDPQFDYCRRGLTKVNSLITTIDDVYDIYGTLDELELFTAAVERWDISTIGQLPDYMKLCFLALYNTINEMAYVTLKEQGWDIIRYLKKSWADLCRAYLIEAKWYNDNYTPTLEEYLDNAWISISGPVILVHAYFFLKQEITMDTLECLEIYPKLIRCSSMILRLSDDLGTSTAELERGDVSKSIQCYMNENGVSEEVARKYIGNLINDIWKKMNKYRSHTSLFSKTYVGVAVNLARMAQCMYQYGDGHGVPDQETKDRVFSLLVEPILLV